jgi:hypothetical protein
MTWTTVDEIRFITCLSKELKQKYKDSIKGRVVWDDIDKDEVIAYLEGKAKIVNGAGPKGRAYVKLEGED